MASGDAYWSKMFNFVELVDTMRQQEDTEFRDALDHLGEGTCTNADVDLLMSLQDSVSDWSSHGHDVTCIYRTNAKVDDMNSRMASLFSSDTFEYHSRYR